MKRLFSTLRPGAVRRPQQIVIPPNKSKKTKTTDDLKKEGGRYSPSQKAPKGPVLHQKSQLDNVVKRKWCNASHGQDEEQKYDFSICTQNILADRYVNFKAYAYCQKKYMYQRYRHRKLIQSLEHYKFDVICLQELQGNMLEYIMKRLEGEYEYRYKRITPYDAWRRQKKGDIDEKSLLKHEGVGIFWKKDKFEIVGEPLEIELNKEAYLDVDRNLKSNNKKKKVLSAVCQHSHNVALSIILKDKETDKQISVSTIHGYYRKERFIGQTYQCQNFFTKVHEYLEDKPVSGILICGDFNIYNTSKALEFIEKGKIKIHEKDDELNETNVYKILKRKPRHPLKIKRSYPSKFKPFSHFSARLKQVDVLDYIFHSQRKMKPVQVLRISKKEIKGKFPSQHQNSDHLMLAARFNIFSEKEIKRRKMKKKAKKKKMSEMEEEEEEEEKVFNF